MATTDKMKCTSCNERNGNTRCEGCNILFCLPCMNKHHDGLEEQFQLLMDVRNEVKQSLEISRSKKLNRKQVSCLTEIDAWEEKIIRRIQQMATKARTNVNELLMKHMNEISDRFEQISVQMQQQQKQGDYLENDIEKVKSQLDQLKNDIKHVNEKIQVDSSLSNSIEWDTLIYIVEEELPGKGASQSIYTKDKVTKGKHKAVLGRMITKAKCNDNSLNKVTSAVQSVSIISQQRSTSVRSQQPNTSLIDSIQGENSFKFCIICRQVFDGPKSEPFCSACDVRHRDLSSYIDSSSRSNTRVRPTNAYLPTRDRDYTANLPTVSTVNIPFRITCRHCRFINYNDDRSNNSEFRCLMCRKIIPVHSDNEHSVVAEQSQF